MVKLKKVVKFICDTCLGNGHIRVATGDTSQDFRKNSEIHQCWDCDSEGEFYETISIDGTINNNSSDSIN